MAGGTKRLDFGGVPAVGGAAVFEDSTACDHRGSALEAGHRRSRPGSTRRFAVLWIGAGDGQIQNLVKSEGCRHVYGGARPFGHDTSL